MCYSVCSSATFVVGFILEPEGALEEQQFQLILGRVSQRLYKYFVFLTFYPHTMSSSMPPLALLAAALLLHSAAALSAARSKVAILGASGYTGAELMRLLAGHPLTDIKVLTADRSAGMEFAAIYPQFSYLKNIPKLTKVAARLATYTINDRTV